METLTLDFISDMVCPWCYIGLHRLETAMRLVDRPLRFSLRFHPYLLDPAISDRGVNGAARLRKKYGVDTKSMFAQVEEAARDSDLRLDLSRQKKIYPTVRAHTLLRAAATARAQQQVARALFETHFVEGGNINDVGTLLRVGVKAGLDGDRLRTELTNPAALAQTLSEANHLAESGISGVPFLLVAGKKAISGAQTVPALMQAMRDFDDPTFDE